MPIHSNSVAARTRRSALLCLFQLGRFFEFFLLLGLDCSWQVWQVSYCDQINMAIDRFGKGYDIFSKDPVYRNAVLLCILQIGELVGNLSEAFRAEHPSIPWRQIKLMRNIVAHRYGTIDHTITWDVVENDIPDLKAYCEKLLEQAPQLSPDP